jgi:hypothetical protein
MGSSKVVLIGATSLIVGIYALSIKKVETDYVGRSTKHVAMVQADRLAEAGMRLAINKIAQYNGSLRRLTKKDQNVLGGTVTYRIHDGTSSSANLTVTATIGGVTKTAVAHVTKIWGKPPKGMKSIHRGKWCVTSFYIQG